MAKHRKKYGIYHWDTFDNETILIDQSNTLHEAIEKVKKRYGDRISQSGADVVDIVDDKGAVVERFAVR